MAANTQMGSVNLKHPKHKEALRFLEQGLHSAIELGFRTDPYEEATIANAYSKMSRYHTGKHEYNTALVCLEKKRTIMTELDKKCNV